MSHRRSGRTTKGRWIGRWGALSLWLAASTVAAQTPAMRPMVGAEPTGEPTPARRQIVVRLPAARWSGTGEVLVQPNVHVLDDDRWSGDGNLPRVFGSSPRPAVPTQTAVGMSTGFAKYVPPPEGLPDPLPLGMEPIDGLESGEGRAAPTPVFEELFGEPEPCECEPEYPPPHWLLEDDACDGPGLGTERLATATFEIDSARPFNNYRLRFGATYNHLFPDRAEYLWAKTGLRGPTLPESSVDFQDLKLLLESGTSKFSTGFEIPFRWVDPDVNANHAGLGDLGLTVKTVLYEGDKIMLTQIFRTLFNTGSSKMGIGTGHIALEPGLLGSWHWGERTWLHGELKFRFPTGGTPVFSGQVLEYGAGISHLLWDSDQVALIPTCEVVAWSILNGTKTDPFGVPLDADGDHIVNILPGLRIPLDRGGDLGLVEMGISGGWGVTSERFYEGMWRFDFRIVY